MAAVMAGLVISAAPAHAADLTDESVIPSGSLTFTWNGDPARGCAAVGLCGTRGQMVVKPQGTTEIAAFGRGFASVFFFLNSPGVIRVIRQGAHAGECVDVSDDSFGLDLRLRGGRGLTAKLEPELSSGRCAGPTESDLAGVALPVKRSGGRRASFDLTGSREFGAGPFSGTLVSTLRLRRVRSPGVGSDSFSSGSGSSAFTHVEYVELRYRVSPSPGAIQAVFGAVDDPSCQLLDSCQTTGSLSVSVRRSGMLTLAAWRRVRRRVTARRALRDFRRGRLSVYGFDNVAAEVAESYSWPDGSSCHDSAATPNLQLTLAPPGPLRVGPRVPVALSTGGGSTIQMLRTHCPGPADEDLFGQNGVLGRGSTTAADLLRKHATLAVSEGAEFSGFGYAGRRSGAIELGLTLTRVRAGSRKDQ